jgi:hypothetical protein
MYLTFENLLIGAQNRRIILLREIHNFRRKSYSKFEGRLRAQWAPDQLSVTTLTGGSEISGLIGRG